MRTRADYLKYTLFAGAAHAPLIRTCEKQDLSGESTRTSQTVRSAKSSFGKVTDVFFQCATTEREDSRLYPTTFSAQEHIASCSDLCKAH